MISISINSVQKIQLEHKDTIKNQYDKAKNGLVEIDKNLLDTNEIKYLEEVIQLFESNHDILTKTPKDLLVLMGDMSNIPEYQVKKDGKFVAQAMPIKDKILTALNYTGLRNSFYPKYFATIGIKACVYCNSQLALSVKETANGFSGRFDLDHYHSKHRNPWMSICLFNLYPACAPCNRRKSFNSVEFELYTNEQSKLDKSSFSFQLDPYAKAKFLISKDATRLSCSFKENDVQEGKKKFNDVFHIESLYNTQTDVMEELILKSQIYDVNYRDILKSNLLKLGVTEVYVERIILGNYFLDKDIHKRPLSKFMQDLSRQLGLIGSTK